MSFESEIKQILNNKQTIEPTLFKYTWHLKSFNFDDIINSSSFNNKFYIEHNEKNLFIGLDTCIKYEPNNRSELSELKNNIYKNIISKGENHKFSTKIFGIISFDINKEPSYPWKNIPRSIFYIPKILIYKSGDKYYITFNIDLDKNSDLKVIINEKNNLQKKLNTIESIKYNTPILKTENLYQVEQEYSKIFKNYIQSIKNKSMIKIILSRLKIFKNKYLFSKSKIIKNLDNNCSKFLFEYNNEKLFLGASPEKLISVTKNKFSTEALAGSIPRGDKEKYLNFLDNKKERNEHSLVIEDIKNKLKGKTNDLHFKEEPIIKSYNHIHHLYTPINGSLNKNYHIIDLLTTLYPTSAILGVPPEVAASKIREKEDFDRGWYGGCFGWFDVDGDGRFDVSIRAGLILEKKLYLFAGSGIVKDSNEKDEWEETETKFKQILSFFSK